MFFYSKSFFHNLVALPPPAGILRFRQTSQEAQAAVIADIGYNALPPQLTVRNPFMRPSVALQTHRNAIREIALRHRVKNVRVFGSVMTPKTATWIYLSIPHWKPRCSILPRTRSNSKNY
jgi:hypothetical protein